jgi:predicted N-acetyltransferase YhbS
MNQIAKLAHGALMLASESFSDAPRAEALIEAAFGPGRLAKAAERVRESAEFAPDLSFCAWRDGAMVGTVKMWRARVGETPVVFLGPIAVESSERSAGVGALLVERACEAAALAGETAIVLVGDEPYFGRFGFSVAGEVALPGPVDPKRVLAKALNPQGAALAGLIEAR